MSATAAAGLARLRNLYPRWHFSRVELEAWTGYIARRGGGDGLVIAERTLAALELELRRTEPHRR